MHHTCRESEGKRERVRGRERPEISVTGGRRLERQVDREKREGCKREREREVPHRPFLFMTQRHAASVTLSPLCAAFMA